DENPATARVNCSQCGHGFPNSRLRSRFDRQKLRAQAFSDEENKKQCGHQGRWNNVTKRQTKERVSAVEKHERADQKRNDSAHRQYAVSWRIDIEDEKHERERNQR